MDFFAEVDPVALAALTFAVVGVVQLVKHALEKQWEKVVVIGVAAVAGALLAPFAGEINWFTGLLIGFSSSGLITTATRLGR